MSGWRVPVLAAIAGVILLALLFPRVDPSATFVNTLGRGDAIGRARQLTSRYGVDASGWRAIAAQLTDEKLRGYLAAYPGDSAARLLTPVTWGVVLTEPGGKQTVRVKLFADGRPAEWELKQTGEVRLPSATVRAETVLQDFAGPRAPAFSAVSRRSDDAIERHGWEWSAGKELPLLAKFEVTQRSGRLFSAVLDASYGPEFRGGAISIGRAAANGIAVFLSFVGFCVALFLAVRACVRGGLSWRIPAVLAAAMILWIAIMVWIGSDYQVTAYGQSAPLPVQGDNTAAQSGAETGAKIAVIMAFFGAAGVPFLAGFAFGGAGYAGAQGRLRQKWYSIERLVRGKIFARQVAGPIAAGALCGIAVAAAPYLVATLFRGAALLFHDRGGLDAPAPFSALVRLFSVLAAFGYLGFALPLSGVLPGKRLRLAARATLAAVYLFGAATAFDRLLPSLVTAAIGLVVYIWLYRKLDLLAVATAMLMAHAVTVPFVLLAQPVTGLRDSGLRLLVVLAAGLAAFVNFGIRGEDAEADSMADLLEPDLAAIEGPSLSNRKRLEAEFQVARKAQQDAFPADPPAIAGYTFSGSCDPALQVGGDLYDLFSLPDGRLCLVVADVSGKGVPAALYMMVTKGLLTATTQDSSDLSYILRQINLHLYRACKRKVFVTLAAVAVDPASRRLQYGRAGHNPIIWRRVRQGETLLRKPPGLGLGMCPNEPFSRSLRLEEFDLEPGDAVVLYSDGITEGINASMDQFGEERLMRSVEKADGRSAAETRASILRDLADFTDGTPARDDVTVVVLRVAENGLHLPSVGN